MEKLKKGYCFEGPDQNRLVIIGEAVSQENGQTVYLCQELTGDFRLMIWTAREILGKKETAAEGGSLKRQTFFQRKVGYDTSGDFREESSFAGSSADSTGSKEQLQNMMIRFLEAPSCSEKLELLDLMKGKVTESMLESMAISMDYELGGGSAEEKYYALERFLKTRNRYEGTRLR